VRTRGRSALLSVTPYIVASLVFVVDQSSKLFVAQRLGPDQPMHEASILDGAVLIRYATNTGASFSMLQDRSFILAALGIVLVVVILVMFRYLPNTGLLLRTSLGFQLGGALGNLADRFRLGAVVDFIDVRFWPVFNIADAALVGGVCLFVLYLVLSAGSQGGDGVGNAQSG
jgi:signal peptidase II